MMTDSDDEACPGCGDTTGVQPTIGTSPKVKAWSCTACRTDWAITTVTPQPYFDRLAVTVERFGATRSVLRQVITPTDDAATLWDQELRDRLLALADRARLAQRPLAVTADQSHRFALTGQAPGGDSGGCQ
jgi:ribosomal protein L37AE/L43A